MNFDTMEDTPLQSFFISSNSSAKITSWNVAIGDKVRRGMVILSYSLIEPMPKLQGDNVQSNCQTDESTQQLKSTLVGVVRETLYREGEVVPPGAPVVSIEKKCDHSVVVFDLCTDCGLNLRKGKSGPRPRPGAPSSERISMVHGIPEIQISRKEAELLANKDKSRLLQSRKLALIIDLDQTLIHTSINSSIEPGLPDVYGFRLPGHSVLYHCRLRPHARQFLLNVSQYYETHVFTMGTKLYAASVTRILDPNQKLFYGRIISRDDCFDPNSKALRLKSVFPCGDAMVAIIDDREDVWGRCPNLIHVKPYVFFAGTSDINAPPGSHSTPSHPHKQNNSSQITPPTSIRTPESCPPNISSKTQELVLPNQPNSPDETQEARENKSAGEDETKSPSDESLSQSKTVESSSSSDSSSDSEDSSSSTSSSDVDDTLFDDLENAPLELPPQQQDSLPGVTVSNSINSGEKVDSPLAEQNETEKTVVKENETTLIGTETSISAENETTLIGTETSISAENETTLIGTETSISAESETTLIETETTVLPNNETEAMTTLSPENETTAPGTETAQSGIQMVTRVPAEDMDTESPGNQDVVLPTEVPSPNKSKTTKIRDPDDFLLHLSDTLERVYKSFYSEYDKMASQSRSLVTPDLKEIIPRERQSVLKGTKIVFTGVIPTNMPPEKSREWNTARAFGATIHDRIVYGLTSSNPRKVMNATTHVIAGKPGTSKLREAKRMPGIKIVSPKWLWSCAEQWKLVDEREFPVRFEETDEREKGPAPKLPKLTSTQRNRTGAKKTIRSKTQTEEEVFGEDAADPLSLPAEIPTIPSEKPRVPERHLSIESCFSFSDEELERMNAEVDAEIRVSSSSSSDEENMEDSELGTLVEAMDNEDSLSYDTFAGTKPSGGEGNRKRKHDDASSSSDNSPVSLGLMDESLDVSDKDSSGSDSGDELAALLGNT